jgi:hypothetical protein
MEIPTFDIDACLRRILSRADSGNINIFDHFIEDLEAYFSRRVTSIAEMKDRDNKRLKGTIFERFCQKWLLASDKYEKVWMWNEVPDDVREQLKLKTRQDNGIDLIGKAINSSNYTAFQCKYRNGKPGFYGRGKSLTWTTLATFIGMCERTGPYEKHVVITNLGSIRNVAQKGPKDYSVCKKRLQGTTRETWEKIAGYTAPTPIPKVEKPKTADELREARLKYFDNKP